MTTERVNLNGKLAVYHDAATFEFDKEQFDLSDVFIKQIQNNGNNTSVINFITASYPLPIGHFLLRLKDFVNGMLWFRGLHENEYIGNIGKNGEILTDYIIENNLVDDFSEFLSTVSEQNFKFTFVKPEKGAKFLFCNIDGENVLFENIISTGTKSLVLLYYWYKHFDSNNVSFVFIDEFDAFYHFRLSMEVCKRLSRLNCQVFMSSHNTYLMTNDLLRPDCNFILNNNVIKPLSECTEKEIRFGNNVEKLYRGGAFSL